MNTSNHNPFAAPESNDVTQPLSVGDYKFAGFWIRLLAVILDTILLLVVIFALVVAGVEDNPWSEEAMLEAAQMSFFESMTADFHQTVGYWIYVVAMWTAYGATIGKLALKVQIIHARTGQKIRFLRSVARLFAQYISGPFTLGLGYLWAAWDKEKRTFHDMICGTRVVKK